ncbi:MAG TPA: hypothetical protein VMT67_13960, partial [Terriglobales bacterium]|nr:hypothetical protein [Terriglobales bacterium]
AKMLPRQPGTKESRYAHLLSGDVSLPETSSSATGPATSTYAGESGRIARLEEEVSSLRKEVADLKTQLEGFRKQFE